MQDRQETSDRDREHPVHAVSMLAAAIVCGIALVVIGPARSYGADARDVQTVKQTALISITAHLDLKAGPAKVWSVLANVESFGALTGFKPDPAGKGHSFSRLGDSVAASIWGDKGYLIVTTFNPGRELRVTWEAENGSYLCEKRIVLAGSGTGTSMDYMDRYSDDQPNAAETAQKVREETVASVAAFRALVEK